MFIRLKAYLSELGAQEQNKPPSQQRPIPSYAELARAIGMTPQGFSNIVNNNIRQLSLETGAKIITEMRRRGFDTEVSDLLAYAPPDKAHQVPA